MGSRPTDIKPGPPAVLAGHPGFPGVSMGSAGWERRHCAEVRWQWRQGPSTTRPREARGWMVLRRLGQMDELGGVMPITTWKAGGLTDDEGIQDYGQDTLARLSRTGHSC